MVVEHGPGWSRVNLRGEVDMGWVLANPRLQETLLQNDPTHVVVGVDNVTFIDSTGISFFVGLLRQSKPAEGSVYLVGDRDHHVVQSLRLVGLDRHVVVVSSEQERNQLRQTLSNLQ